jgi:hypothetical protein
MSLNNIRSDKLVYKLLLHLINSFDFEMEHYNVKYIQQSAIKQFNNQIIVGKSDIIGVDKTSTSLNLRNRFQVKILSKQTDYEKAFDNIDYAVSVVLFTLLFNSELKYRNIEFISSKNYINEQYSVKMTILDFNVDDMFDKCFLPDNCMDWIVNLKNIDYEVV